MQNTIKKKNETEKNKIDVIKIKYSK